MPSKVFAFLSPLLVAVALFGSCSPSLFAQANGANNGGANNNNGGANNNNGGANNNNNNNNNNSGVAGIDIDAQGVLRVQQSDPRVALAMRQAALRGRNNATIKNSPMRKVSLNRLESAVAEKIRATENPSQEMMSLAGLTRVEYVFYFSDSKEIVLAGPAEETMQDSTGRVLGLSSGRPTVRLDDLIVALRAFSPSGNKGVISCSIDPSSEGLVRLNAFLKSLGGQIGNRSEFQIANGMRNSLGLQMVSVKGVPDTTHFARVLVEADYRMKLVGIGLESPMIPITSWVARANPQTASSSAMQRWYFTTHYSGIKTTADRMGLKLEGQGVKLVGENERVAKDGTRQASSKSDPASKGFTQEFTQKFDAVADSTPIFYEMRNLFDLSVAAAFVQEQDFYGLSGWNLGTFADEKALPVQVYSAPKQVETAVNVVWKNGKMMTPIGGGIHISAKTVLGEDRSEVNSLGSSLEGKSVPSDLKADQWWWD